MTKRPRRPCPSFPEKTRYASERIAQAALQAILDGPPSRNGYKPVAAYHCDGCHGWHLTSGERKRYTDEAPAL